MQDGSAGPWRIAWSWHRQTQACPAPAAPSGLRAKVQPPAEEGMQRTDLATSPSPERPSPSRAPYRRRARAGDKALPSGGARCRVRQACGHAPGFASTPARQAGSRLFHAAAARWIPSWGLDVLPQGTAGIAQTFLNAHRLTHGATAAAGRRISTTTSVTTVSGTTKPSMTPENACNASCCCAARIR
jgi:hypothetical protein